MRDREGLLPRPDLFWIDWGRHPVCPTICVMFLASHQALLSGNNARRLMCAGGAAEHSANSVQQIWILCHMTAPRGAEKPKQVNNHTRTHAQTSRQKHFCVFKGFSGQNWDFTTSFLITWILQDDSNHPHFQQVIPYARFQINIKYLIQSRHLRPTESFSLAAYKKTCSDHPRRLL